MGAKLLVKVSAVVSSRFFSSLKVISHIGQCVQSISCHTGPVKRTELSAARSGRAKGVGILSVSRRTKIGGQAASTFSS